VTCVRQQAYARLKANEYRVAREFFEQVFHGNDADVARCLGFLWLSSSSKTGWRSSVWSAKIAQGSKTSSTNWSSETVLTTAVLSSHLRIRASHFPKPLNSPRR
jgi:hypothetical protein